jgi:hypothetical protein
MKILRSTTEDDMIAVFLGGEYTSARFGRQVRKAMEKLKAEDAVITDPDLTNRNENDERRKILKLARGYASGKSWFTGMPKNIAWYRAEFERKELPNIRYIVYSYWIELTNGTLRAGDAVKTINDGQEIFGVSNEPFHKLADAIASGQTFPPIIIVGTGASDLVVLEGHARLTGYLLAGQKAPAKLEAIVGLAPDFTNWKMYSFAAYDHHRDS